MATIDELNDKVIQMLQAMETRPFTGLPGNLWGTPADYSVLVRQTNPTGGAANPQNAIEDLEMGAYSVVVRQASGDITTVSLGADEALGRSGAGDIGGVSISAASNHNLLSATHSDTAASSPPTRGSIIRANSSPVWEEYALGTTNYYLRAGASDVEWGQVSEDHLDPTYNLYDPAGHNHDTLYVSLSGDTMTGDLTIVKYSIIVPPAFIGERARGSVGTPATVQSGDILLNLRADGYESGLGDFETGGSIQFVLPDNWGPSSYVTKIKFNACLVNDTTVTTLFEVGANSTDPTLVMNPDGEKITIDFPVTGGARVIADEELLLQSTNQAVQLGLIPHIWPNTDGSSGNFIITDGAGTLSWSSGESPLELTVDSAVATTGPLIDMARTRAGGQTNDGDYFGQITFSGHNGTGEFIGAEIRVEAQEDNIDANSQGTYLSFWATADSGSSTDEVWRLGGGTYNQAHFDPAGAKGGILFQLDVPGTDDNVIGTTGSNTLTLSSLNELRLRGTGDVYLRSSNAAGQTRIIQSSSSGEASYEAKTHYFRDNLGNDSGTSVAIYGNLSVFGTVFSYQEIVVLPAETDTPLDAGVIELHRARVGPAAIQDADAIGYLDWKGHDGTDYETGFAIDTLAKGNWSGTNRGSETLFKIVPENTVSALEIFRLTTVDNAPGILVAGSNKLSFGEEELNIFWDGVTELRQNVSTGYSHVWQINSVTEMELDATKLEVQGYVDSVGGYYDNGVAGVDGTIYQPNGAAVTVAGGIITNDGGVTSFHQSYNGSFLFLGADDYYIQFTGSVNTALSVIPTAATLGAGFKYIVKHAGTGGTITFNPQGSETVDGELTWDIEIGESYTFVCDGSNWDVI